MKRTCAALIALIMCFSLAAVADEGFDGSVYEAYMPVYDEETLMGREVISYIEPSGLLLSALNDTSEISVTVEESDENPEVYLSNRLAGVGRYGKDIKSASPVSVTLAGFEKAAKISYSFRSQRDSGSGDIYYVDTYAAGIKTGYMLVISLTSWGKEADEATLSRFVAGFSLEQVKISTTYTAFLTYCERKSDGIYLTLDFCDMEYESAFDLPYALNEDDTQHVYKLNPEAQIWLPDLDSALYSLKRASADEIDISIAIETYYNINEVFAVYMVLFNENGEIIRMQHYNAL